MDQNLIIFGTEDDAGVRRFTANALEEAPSGTGGDATAASQTTIISHLTGIKGGTWLETTDSLEAIRDRGDTAWLTGAGGSSPTVEQIRIEMDTNSTKMAPSQTLGDYKATGFATLNPPSQILADYRATGYSTHDAAAVWAAVNRELSTPADYKATGFSTHSAAAVKTAMEADGGKLDHIWETTEDDAGVRRFTENALEEAPSGTSTGATAQEVWEYATRELSTPANYKADVSALALATVCTEVRLARLDAAISSRSSHGDPDPSGFIDVAISSRNDTTPPTTDAIKTKIEEVGSSMAGVKAKTDNLKDSWNDPTAEACKATGFSTHNAAAIWTATGRELSTPADYKADVLALATSAEIGLLNDITVANVETACDSAIDNAIASPTSGSLGYYMQKMFIAQVNKMVVTETNGNTEQFNDSNVTIGSIGGAITSDGTYTTRLRMVQ
jgi:hypothetical protein